MLSDFYQTELLPLAKCSLNESVDDFISLVDAKGEKEYISTNEIIRRIAETDIGKNISESLDGNADELIDEIATRYEELGSRYSENYRKYAGKWNMIFSILLAFALNINLVTIVQTIQLNPATQALIMEKAIAHSTQNSSGNDEAEIKNDEVEIEKEDIQQLLSEINNLNIPYGWPKAPFQQNKGTEIEILEYLNAFKTSIFLGIEEFSLGWIIWIVTTLLTGLLIGLGAPFWFDVVKQLMSINRFAGTVLSSSNKKQAKDDKQTNRQEKPQAVFEKAIKAQQAVNKLQAQLYPKQINLDLKL